MKKEKVLIVSVVAIVIFGLIMIYSSSYIWAEYKFEDAFHYVKNQSIFAIVGFLMMHFMSKIDYHIYKEKSNMILGIAIYRSIRNTALGGSQTSTDYFYQ